MMTFLLLLAGLAELVVLLAMFILPYVLLRRIEVRQAGAAVGGLVAGCFGLWLLFLATPYLWSVLFFHGLILHLPHFAVGGATLVVAIVFLVALSHERTNEVSVKGALLAAATALTGVFAMVFVCTADEWRLCQEHRPTVREELVMPNPAKFRVTPHQIAYQEMVNTFNSAEYGLDLDCTHPVDVDGGFGYVCQITPGSNLISALLYRCDGFVVFNDSSGISNEQRIRRVKLPFSIGQRMLLRDSLQRQLHRADPFATYEGAYAMQIGGKDDWQLVVPKLKYRFRFPQFVPYWAGVVLVDSQGALKTLSVEEALADPRLAGRRLFPEGLGSPPAIDLHATEYNFNGGDQCRERL